MNKLTKKHMRMSWWPRTNVLVDDYFTNCNINKDLPIISDHILLDHLIWDISISHAYDLRMTGS